LIGFGDGKEDFLTGDVWVVLVVDAAGDDGRAELSGWVELKGFVGDVVETDACTQDEDNSDEDFQPQGTAGLDGFLRCHGGDYT
jgi:hypothetical protein